MSFLAQLKVHFTNHLGNRGELDKERHHQATSDTPTGTRDFDKDDFEGSNAKGKGGSLGG